MKGVFYISFLIPFLLFACIEDHLKKVDRTQCFSEANSMRHIDFIYMINLDQRPEKWKLSTDQLRPYGIIPCRFSAVNGWELSLEAINDVGLTLSPEMDRGFMATTYLHPDLQPQHEPLEQIGRSYFCHCMARGTIGIALSHISILQDAYEQGYETIWVMEDDIQVIKDPHLLSDLIAELDATLGQGNWDVLFTDRDMLRSDGSYNPCHWAARRPDITDGMKKNDYWTRTPVNGTFWKIGARYGAHSMIIRRSGIKKLLMHFKAHQIYLPYDLEFILPLGIQLYALQDDVITNLPKALSDNGGPNYLTKE